MFTAAVLAAAAMLLGLPEGREAIRTVRASWQSYQEWMVSGPRSLEELAARAEKQNDANTLAFVALSTRDPNRAEALTERVVALDPQFIWIYGSRHHGPDADPPREERLARLQAADPDNTAPYLLEAYAAAGPRVEQLSHGLGMKDADFEALESNAKWMGLMDRAFRAPRYDSYFDKHCQLTRAVWNREKNLSPMVVLSGLWTHAIPSLLSLRVFSEAKIHEAQKARAAGDLKRAESLLNQVDEFGIRMADGSGTDIEKLIAWSLSQGADKELTALYSSAGRTGDEKRATARRDQMAQRFKEQRLANNPSRGSRTQAFRKEAMLVEGFGILCIVAAFAALAGILVLELWPCKIQDAKPIWRRVACWAADYAPAILLISCGAFLVSFLPFQRVFQEYRASKSALFDREPLMEAMWGLLEVPRYLTDTNAAVSIWTFITIALSALLVFVLARGFYRMRRTVAESA
ncbi:MAG TPA: hypothetical protein VK525_17565 [Candidatus Saccharimonadales bacterium]|nr:hypothetical protein [Candidatus Saccharimonadales bacterium]